MLKSRREQKNKTSEPLLYILFSVIQSYKDLILTHDRMRKRVGNYSFPPKKKKPKSPSHHKVNEMTFWNWWESNGRVP
jgi:hypothetical protein